MLRRGPISLASPLALYQPRPLTLYPQLFLVSKVHVTSTGQALVSSELSPQLSTPLHSFSESSITFPLSHLNSKSEKETLTIIRHQSVPSPLTSIVKNLLMICVTQGKNDMTLVKMSGLWFCRRHPPAPKLVIPARLHLWYLSLQTRGPPLSPLHVLTVPDS